MPLPTSIIHSPHGRGGFALPLALLGLILVSVLVTGVLLSSSAEVALSGAHQDAVRSLYVAESGLEAYIAERSATFAADAGKDGSFSFTPTDAPATSEVRIEVTQIAQVGDETTYYIRSEPVNAGGRTLAAMITRAEPITLDNIDAAASFAGQNVNITANAKFSRYSLGTCSEDPGNNEVVLDEESEWNHTGTRKGQDDRGAGWEDREQRNETLCSLLGRNCEEEGIERSDMNTEEFREHILGDQSFEDLAALADIKFGFDGQPTFDVTANAPNADPLERGDPLNWGCPDGLVAECRFDPDTAYYPVVAIDASDPETSYTGNGYGQGMLIIFNAYGDNQFTMNFDYEGVILVDGSIKITSNTVIDGALVVLGDAEVGNQETEATTNIEVHHNRCAIQRAMDALNDGNATGASRTFAWTELVRG